MSVMHFRWATYPRDLGLRTTVCAWARVNDWGLGVAAQKEVVAVLRAVMEERLAWVWSSSGVIPWAREVLLASMLLVLIGGSCVLH